MRTSWSTWTESSVSVAQLGVEPGSKASGGCRRSPGKASPGGKRRREVKLDTIREYRHQRLTPCKAHRRLHRNSRVAESCCPKKALYFLPTENSFSSSNTNIKEKFKINAQLVQLFFPKIKTNGDSHGDTPFQRALCDTAWDPGTRPCRPLSCTGGRTEALLQAALHLCRG